jgi:hypothetical protein
MPSLRMGVSSRVIPICHSQGFPWNASSSACARVDSVARQHPEKPFTNSEVRLDSSSVRRQEPSSRSARKRRARGCRPPSGTPSRRASH